MKETLDVHLYFHDLSRSWTIDLRRTGCRRMLSRYDSTVPYAFVERQAIDWADFLGATLTRDLPADPAPLPTREPC